MPRTSSITKYGRPLSAAPASSTLAIFGWSMSANACLSASNRATTCFVSIPSLTTLTATFRRTGSVCSAIQTAPMPPSPINWSSLYLPMLSPGFSLEAASGASSTRMVGAGVAGVSSLPPIPANLSRHCGQWPPGASGGNSAPQPVHFRGSDMIQRGFTTNSKGIRSECYKVSGSASGDGDKQTAQLIIHFGRAGYGLGNLRPQQLAKTAAQTAQGNTNRFLLHGQFRRHARVNARRDLAGDERFKAHEQPCLVTGGAFAFQIVECLLQDG